MRLLSIMLSAGVLAACVTACANQGDDPNDDVEDIEASSDSKRPLGTYAATGERGDLARIVLAVEPSTTNRIIHAELVGRGSGPTPSVLPFNGRFKYTKSRGKRFIRMETEDGELFDRYEYKDGDFIDTIKIRRAGTREWFDFQKADRGWCGETIASVAPETVCQRQGLVSALCRGHWTCEQSQCDYECGPGRPPVDPEVCEGYDGAIDSCIGLDGQTFAQCIESLAENGAAALRQELETCCTQSSDYMFCDRL